MATATTAIELLRSVYGYDSFRGDQQAVIDCLAAGGDALVLMPTGAGKSLCYQIPALLRPGVGVVVSPLIALMHDQVGALRQLGVRAAYLNSSLAPLEAAQVERQLRSGELDLLYAAPERVMTPRFLDLLAEVEVALVAIDEAHCVSQWGHDFRPEYLQLAALRERFPAVPHAAMTATADPRTRREIAERLQLREPRWFVGDFDRPNIRYTVVTKQEARRQLLAFLADEHADDSGIVYCLTRRRVEEVAAYLQSEGYNAAPYHAGLDADERRRTQDRFLADERMIVVATIAFGMGIDKPDVRFVAHLDVPKSIEAYYQETGRAGRDGAPADAWMTYGAGDAIMLRSMLARSDADERHKQIEQHKLDVLLGFCETTQCRRRIMLSHLGQELAEPCGNCDTCLNQVALFDGTVVAQKALSAVARTGERFGAAHLTDLLLGESTEKIVKFGHDQLKTFGVGGELDRGQWRSVFRQLVAGGLLGVDGEGFGTLRLSAASADVLRGQRAVQLRIDPPRVKKSRKSSTAKRASVSRNLLGKFASTADEALWEALRQLRAELAREQSVPPYVIFHDRTLHAIVEVRPTTVEKMSQVHGVGRAKLQRFGEAVLECVRANSAEFGLG